MKIAIAYSFKVWITAVIVSPILLWLVAFVIKSDIGGNADIIILFIIYGGLFSILNFGIFTLINYFTYWGLDN